MNAVGPSVAPWARVALTALACALTGWLALRLAIAPNHASLFYPPAGIALAAALAWGRPGLLGAALGSFAANVALGAERGEIAPALLLTPALIGLGVALQAAVGAWLVRRFVRQPLTLTEPRDLWRFYALGAPLACLVSATVGTLALGLGGTLGEAAWARAWWSWWVGDTLGVLIGAPIVLALIGQPRAVWAPRRTTVALPLLLASALLAVLSLQAAQTDEARVRAAFERDASTLANRVEDRLREPLLAMQAMHSLFVAQGEVSREQMQRAAAQWVAAPPLHLQALGWSPRVPRQAVAAFEAAVRAEPAAQAGRQARLADYRVFDRADGVATNADDEVVAIRFLEPLAPNAEALGVNTLSIPAARAAVFAARDSGQPTSSAGFRLTQTPQDEIGLVIYRAIYDSVPGAQAPGDVAARRAAFRGVVFAALRVEALLSALSAEMPASLHWCLLDAEPGAAPRRMAGPAGCEAQPAAPLQLERPLPIAGRTLALRVAAQPLALAGPTEDAGWRAAVASLFGAALLGALLLLASGRQWRVQQLVDERTADLQREVAERERVVAALRDSQQRQRNILDHVPIGVLFADPQGHIREVNPSLVAMLDSSAAALLERTLEDLTHPEDRGEDALLVGRLLAGRLPLVRRRKRLLTADGHTRWVQMTLSVLRDDAGQAARLVGVVEDITDQLRLHDAEQARARAQSANLAKTEFVSRMSHELRTPLNAMLGFAQLLGMDGTPALAPHQLGWALQIERAGWHLLELIDETLDLSLIEAGALRLQPAAVALPPLLDEVQSLLADKAAQRGLHIEQRIDPALDHVRADATRLRQILTNLLSNAVKYNIDGGRIVIEARQPDPARVEISVSDSGLGMDTAQMDALFEPFNRLGREQSSITGTGIGLALSRRLAELMGGTLSATSTAGEGSTFTLLLPGAPPAASVDEPPPQVPAPQAAGGHRRVHYIEDNATNVEVMRAILAQRPGVQLGISMLGLDGLAAVRMQRPQLILLDMQLPDIDGLELLRHLKQGADTAAIPVLIVSADATPARVVQALAAGAAGYMGKPFDITAFLATVDRLLGEVDAKCTATSTPPATGDVAPAAGGVHLAPVPGLRPAARRPDPGRQRRPDEGRQALRPRAGRAPGELRDALDQGRDPRVHPEELAHGQGGHHQGAAQAVLQPALDEAGLKGDAADADTHRSTLTPAEVDTVARELNVKPDEVVEMETRLAAATSRSSRRPTTARSPTRPIAYLADDSSEPTRRLEARHRDWLAGDGIGEALEVLDARSRRIVEERWLKVNDDSSGGMTLHELAAEYGVSAERIRQIEVAAMKKMRKALERV
jgi:RNA polymerase sigma factor (sigma-70 family)